jgi:hypothetical protein
MEFTWPIFLVGIILGIVQLAVGVMVGRALPLRRGRSKPPGHLNIEGAHKLAARVHRLVVDVADDVCYHQLRIEQMSTELASLKSRDSEEMIDRVLGYVSEIVSANDAFQERLKAVEDKLHAHVVQPDTAEPDMPEPDIPEPDIPEDPELQAIRHDLRSRLAELSEIDD